jgi:topoisomerase-4 subunit A
MKGHGHNPKEFKYKDGDRGNFVIEAQTTDKILVFGSNGRFYTLAGDKLPPGRGFGEPVRLMVDLPNDADIVDMQIYDGEKRMLVAADDGRGFIVKMEDVLAQTKNGKQILNVSGTAEAKLCYPINDGDDHVAVIGKNRKMLVFALADVPEMARGRGVMLQKFKDGGLADLKTFKWDNGLSYRYGGGETVVPDLNPWLGERAQAGKMPPNGFPKSNKFNN